MSPEDFSIVTELPGNEASAEQLAMINTRYGLAYELCGGKDVLEAACGPGRALGYLARKARSVVGGDFTPGLVDLANRHYGGRVRVLRMDAQAMPFADRSFDLVLLFEALYYLPDVYAFLGEARRVLRPAGTLLVCTTNREWPGFNPSPLSHRYFSAGELRRLLSDAGFAVEVRAGFPARDTWAGRALTSLRRAAIALDMMPRTMESKAWLKRLFYGKLQRLGPEIDPTAPVMPLQPVRDGPVKDHKVLYAVAQRLG